VLPEVVSVISSKDDVPDGVFELFVGEKGWVCLEKGCGNIVSLSDTGHKSTRHKKKNTFGIKNCNILIGLLKDSEKYMKKQAIKSEKKPGKKKACSFKGFFVCFTHVLSRTPICSSPSNTCPIKSSRSRRAELRCKVISYGIGVGC
jgi:hypothetical protein